jgi:3-(3-hydroxy-phenyl)propionate hydroxylase
VIEGATVKADLIIVGLGPVGAVAANLAGAAGFKTIVLERNEEPYRMPRAVVFDAEIMRIFASIGLADEIAAVTKPIGGSVYLGADRKPIRTFRAHPPPHALAWHPANLFYQPQLEAILRSGIRRYPNVTLLSGREVVAFEQKRDGSRVRATDANGDELVVESDYLIAADGASSTIRKSLGVALDDIGFEERWLVIDTLVNGPMRWPDDHTIPPEVKSDDFSLMVCDPSRPCTLIPGAGKHRRWEYMLLANETDEEVTTDSWLRRQLGRWIDPNNVEIIRSAVYRFRALVAEQWRANSVFLIGDAAHQTPPFFGQGMCHGIRDAAQLMWKLDLVRKGLADAALLDSYQLEREPHVRAIISASVTAGAEVCKLDPAEATARDKLFRDREKARDGNVALSDVVPPIRAGVIQTLSGGARLPELTVTDARGTLRLDEIMGGAFALITIAAGYAPPAEWTAIGGRVLSATGNLSAWLLHNKTQWAIIRPDRYIYATGADQADLSRAMTDLFAQLHLTPSARLATDRFPQKIVL